MLRSVSDTETGRDTAPGEDVHHAAAAMYDLLVSFVRLMPRDMSLTSVSALATLDRTGPRRITDLAASEGVTQPSVTTLVTTLTKAGYVERRSDPNDKRVVVVAITEKGTAYLRERRAKHTQIVENALGDLSADELAALNVAVPTVEHLHRLVDELRANR